MITVTNKPHKKLLLIAWNVLFTFFGLNGIQDCIGRDASDHLSLLSTLNLTVVSAKRSQNSTTASPMIQTWLQRIFITSMISVIVLYGFITRFNPSKLHCSFSTTASFHHLRLPSSLIQRMFSDWFWSG